MANNIVVFDTGRLRLMRMLVEGGYNVLDGHVSFHLFVNDMTLPSNRMLADFTEMVMTGYSPQVLDGALDEGIDSNDSDTWLWPEVAVTCGATPGSPIIAYGYYVTHNDDGELLWGQLFDVPPVWTIAGDSYEFPLQLSLGACCHVDQPKPFELFEIDAALAGRHHVNFSVDGDLIGPKSTTFQIDADLYAPVVDSFFIDAHIARRGQGLFFVFATIADSNSEMFSIDAAVQAVERQHFSVDGLVIAQPGVIIRGPGEGAIIGPAGIHFWNIFIWGHGGQGGPCFFTISASGGGGGGYAERVNTPATPFLSYGYYVDPPLFVNFSYMFLDVYFIGATFGSNGTEFGGGVGGYGMGCDEIFFGGKGGDGSSGVIPEYGSGGGSGANWLGNGLDGQDAGATGPGFGGNAYAAFWSGGFGANPYNSEFGEAGHHLGGGGGGAGSLIIGSGGHQSGYGDGMLVVTWQAGIFWIDGLLSGENEFGFGIDGSLRITEPGEFHVDAFVAFLRRQIFDVDAALAAFATVDFSVDADIVSQASVDFSIDAAIEIQTALIFSVDAQIISRQTIGFTIDADIENVDYLVANDGVTPLLANDGVTLLTPG